MGSRVQEPAWRRRTKAQLPRLFAAAGATVAAVLWVLVIRGSGHTLYLAVEWSVGTIALLAVVRPEARSDGFRLPRKVVRHRDVLYADIDHIALPHPLSTNSTGTIVLVSGERIRARGFTTDVLERAARDHGLVVERDPAPAPLRPAPTSQPPAKPFDVAREADIVDRRNQELRRQLDQLRRT